MNEIIINDKQIVFKDGFITFNSTVIEKVITYEQNDEKSFLNALMQIINLIEVSKK